VAPTFHAIPILRIFDVAKVMEVIDPFGNRLPFNEPIDPAPR
jgi:hypothetical protein